MIMMPPIILSQTAFLLAAVLLQASDDIFVVATTTSSGRQIDGVASTGNTIHAEQDIDLSSLPYRTTVNVTSDVPVTVERYNDNAYYLEGQQPLLSNMAKVLVTSNCDTSETTVIPSVAYENGTITVAFEGVSTEEANGMEFLEPSYYEAFWTWAGGFCGVFTSSTSGTPPAMITTVATTESSASGSTSAPAEIVTTTTTTVAGAAGTECQVGSSADPALDCAIEGEFCQLDTGVCNNKSGIHYGLCVEIPQSCTEEYNPVCGCDEQDYSNACAAHGQGVSVSRMGQCTTTTTTSAATETSASGSTTTVATDAASGTECQVGPSADPTMDCSIDGEFCQLDMGVCNNKSGIQYGVCATVPQACTLEYNPVCGCDDVTYSNACAAYGQGVSVSRMGQCTTTSSAATESSGGTSTVISTTGGQECQVGPSADPTMGCATEGEFCQLDTGVCNNKSGIHYGACVAIPQACTFEYDPVCGCDGEDYSNECAAHGNGVSVSRLGQCTNSNTTSVATEPSSSGSSTVSEAIVTTTVATGTECQIGPSADPALDCAVEGEFCQLESGVCNNKSGIHYGVCVTIPQACTFEYNPVCGCDGLDYGNACAAHGNGVSVSRLGQCTNSNTTSVATEPSSSGSSTVSEAIVTTTGATGTECQIGPSADPALDCAVEGEFCQLETGVCNNKSGIRDGVCVTIPQACTFEYNPVCGCDGLDYGNACAAHGNGVSVSRLGQCTNSNTTSVATEASSTTGATTASNTGTTTEFAGVGDFPTGAPTSNSSTIASKEPQSDEARGTSPNSAFSHSCSISVRIASALIVIVVVSVLLPGNGSSSQYLWGLSKFAVAAVAVTSLYSRPSRSFRNMQNSNQGSNSSPTQKFVRNLKTCSFNVEILVDGCTKSVAVDAPAGRVIDVVLVNQTSELSPDDNCTSSFEANLTFPATNEITMDLSENNTVEAFDEFDFRCLRAIDGRPFVDASGGGLLAQPCAISSGYNSAASALSWIGKQSADVHNITTHGHHLLGEYWTQRALGEHASVASFSAFSIALMTNQAPSDLVERALKAGLDEVRHAKTSFEIASILAGTAISPGPLPPSNHEFHHDLTSLAMAVAKEGCVDETISAFAAAAEAAHITEVMEQRIQDSKYSNVDRGALTFIRDELTNISMDESNHAALAWQTLRWVCSIDSSSCDAVYNDVFDESILESRFIQRARNSIAGELTSPDAIKSEWKKIFISHLGVDSDSICEGKDDVIAVTGSCHGHPLFTSMTDNILRQISLGLVETF